MRYAEQQAKEPVDFVPRRRIPTPLQYILVFAILYLLIILVFQLSSGVLSFSAQVFVVIVVLAFFIGFTVRYNRDLMLATEFQNAILANAFGTDYKFSLIVRADGGLIYIDRGFQELFPRFSHTRHHHLNDFIDIAKISRDHGEAIYSAIDSGAKQRMLLTITTPDGKPMQLVLTTDPISRPGKFVLLRAREFIAKRAQAAATPAQEQDYAEIPSVDQSLSIGVLSADASGRIIFANDHIERWLGYIPGQLTESAVYIEHLFHNSRAAFDKQHQSGPVGVIRRSGEITTLYADTEVEYRNGNIAGMGAIFYLPDHVPSAAARTSSLASIASTSPAMTDIQSFIASAPLAIAHCDNNGNIQYVNEAFHVLTQHRYDMQIPVSLLDLVASDKRQETAEKLSALVSGRSEQRSILTELILPGGQQVNASIYCSSSGDNGIIFYLIDVTEQKNLELRFAHSQKMQAVGQLAGGVAHDFNNLLTAMIGFCDLLLMRHPAGDQSFADIMQIKQNANRAANLVRQLLAFSRRQTLQPKMLDITEVLAELSNLIRRLIGENIELKMVHGRDIGAVKADQGQLEQVLINLAVNARDAMKDGGILTIQSSHAVVDAAHPISPALVAPPGEDNAIPKGEYIVLKVEDTGTGIPADVVPKIFEPFFSTKEIGSGTGLGLSTVYGIIKQTGGYIFVSSQLGRGTQFYIYFPSYQPDAAQMKAAEAPEKSDLADLTGRECILLVEDEAPVRTFAARALRNKGYTVNEADCAETALEFMRQHGTEVDLIVTDVIMPGMNGPTMIENLTADYPDIKVIFISGYAEDIFMNSYGSERSFNFLAKPFTLKQLASKVKEVMGGK